LRADSTRPKEWLEIEKVRPIGFIGKDILALEKKIMNQQREQEQHPGIGR